MAKSKSVKIYISTGRPLPLITNLSEIKHLIDGYITTNGALCFYGDEVISCRPIPHDDVMKMIELSDRIGFPFMLVGEKDLTMYNNNEDSERIFRQLLNVQNLRTDNNIEPILRQRILQLSPVISKAEEEKIMPYLKGCISGRWHPDFTDITAQDANKGNGLLDIIARQGISIDETMAFGDGGNDMSIIQKAGIGVAMGNAVEALKRRADFVTKGIDEDGVAYAMEELGLI